jgi:hypothetical protein
MSCDDFEGVRKKKLKEVAKKFKGKLSSQEFFDIMKEGLLSIRLDTKEVKQLLKEVLDSN